MTPFTMFGYVFLPALVFGVAYFPMTRMVRSVGVAYPKADMTRRFVAAGVDLVLLTWLGLYYLTSRSPWLVLAGATFLLFRDSARGRSPGKFLCGLVVVDLGTQDPAGFAASARRNFMLLIPGANAVAGFLEAVTIIRDPQGQRLGDRFALTQVVDGFGVRDLAESFVQAWEEDRPRADRSNPQPDQESPSRGR
jgi:uncharacterized RDD family membrane protein YckC